MTQKDLKSLVERSAQLRKELADLEAEIAKHLPSLKSTSQQPQGMQQQMQPPLNTPPKDSKESNE
jgi:uncharacterized protein involved in exopolysaccharide biosynthesis